MSRYMTAMATRFFPRMALAIGPGPGWRRPPKTRSEKLGTFRSYLTLLHFSETLDRENHVIGVHGCTNHRKNEFYRDKRTVVPKTMVLSLAKDNAV